MSLNEPSVGQTEGPTWATEVNENFTTIDQHDHTSGKGVQLTPSALNINSDLEFNGNAATELKRLTIDSSATGSGTNYSVYQSGGNLYWYNGSGQAVQITNGDNVKTTGGSIDGMESTDAGADYGSGYFKWEFDTTKTPFAGAKMKNADIELHKYDGSSGSNAYVILKYTGSSEGSNNLTFPDETGTLLSTATSFGGAINIDATGGSGSITLDAATSVSIEADTTITLDAEGDINLDSNSGVLTFKDNGTAIGKISNSSSDLVIENEVDAKDIIFKQYDGNEVVRMAYDRRLYFYDKGGEYIYGDGTDLNINSGTAINLNAGVLDLSAQTVDVTLNNAVDALNFDSNTLSIDSQNNRVGIGTAAPDNKMHVTYGDVIDSNSNTGLTVEGSPNEATAESGINILSTTGGHIYFGDAASAVIGRIDYIHTDDSMRFYTNNTNRLQIDSSGNTGIGTTVPSSFITRSGTGRGLVIYNPTDSSEAYSAELVLAAAATNTQCVISFNDGVDSTPNGSILYDLNADDLYFKTGPSSSSNQTRMIISSAGNVGIGVAPTSTIRCNVKDDTTNSASDYIYYGWDASNNARFYVKSNGAIWSNSASTSDQRAKESIVDFNLGLDEVLKLKTKSFRWKINNENLFHGFIAQDVVKHIPDLIHGDPDDQEDELRLDYNGIIACLVNAVKELSTKVTALEGA